MKKIIIIISCILAVIIIGVSFMLFFPKNNQVPIEQGAIEGIEVFYPKSGESILSPLKITGKVNGGGWIGFEGQVGIVKLFDNSGKELALGILTAQGEWMQKEINFETTLWFDYSGEGSGQLIFYNENPSGEAQKNKTFTLPVKLTTSSAATSNFKVYFSNSDIGLDCAKVLPFERRVLKTEAVARAALEELLKGPSDLEKYAGLITSINSGVKINSLTIENGVARVDFSEELEQGVAGSCKVQAIRAQITETLQQFSTVKSVVISVNGRDDILQP